MIGTSDHHHLPAALLEDPVRHTALFEYRRQRCQVFIDRDAEGPVMLGHQFTSALLQRSLSLQLV